MPMAAVRTSWCSETAGPHRQGSAAVRPHAGSAASGYSLRQRTGAAPTQSTEYVTENTVPTTSELRQVVSKSLFWVGTNRSGRMAAEHLLVFTSNPELLVVHTCNLVIQEAKAGDSEFEGCWATKESLSQKKKQKTQNTKP